MKTNEKIAPITRREAILTGGGILASLLMIRHPLVALAQEGEKGENGAEITDGIQIINIPMGNVTPRRRAEEEGFEGNQNRIGLGTEIMLAEPGVIGTYNFDASRENMSAVFMTGRNESTLRDAEAEPQALALPANGYTEITCAYATLRVGEQQITLADLGASHSYVVLVQGTEGDGEQNTDDSGTIVVSNYKPGHTGFREMGVPLGHGSFMSENDIATTVANAHGLSRTSRGDGGTSLVTLVLWSPTEGALNIVRSSYPTNDPTAINPDDLLGENREWENIWNNLQQ